MVRCGNCDGCRKRKKKAWAGRLMLEMSDHFAARFITLTYDDKHLPEQVEPQHLRNFIRRYRYYYGDDFRYFGVGEYGEKTKRPHYHLIIFGHGPEKIGHWENNKAWNMGYCYDGTVTNASIAYVASYTLKKMEKVYGTGDYNQPFTRSSHDPGIGLKRIRELGALYAQETRCMSLSTWPSSYRLGKFLYPLMDGGYIAFKEAFLDAGGQVPYMDYPEAKHVLRSQALAELGTRNRGQKLADVQYWRRLKREINGT